LEHSEDTNGADDWNGGGKLNWRDRLVVVQTAPYKLEFIVKLICLLTGSQRIVGRSLDADFGDRVRAFWTT